VKYWVDTPLGWEFESHSNQGNDLGDFKGTVSSWRQFDRTVGKG
jgi:hypothetical protein